MYTSVNILIVWQELTTWAKAGGIRMNPVQERGRLCGFGVFGKVSTAPSEWKCHGESHTARARITESIILPSVNLILTRVCGDGVLEALRVFPGAHQHMCKLQFYLVGSAM